MWSIQGIRIGRETLTHLLFMDDVLMFTFGSYREGSQLQEILLLYNKATGMEVNCVKSALFTSVWMRINATSLKYFFHISTWT
jgi:hypothetical protein